jgi:hypothetical protein
MHCSRCHGLMLQDHLLDMEGGFGEMWAQSWRCTNCGAIHDAVIAQNRLALEANVAVRTSGQPNLQGNETYLAGEGLVRPAA